MAPSFCWNCGEPVASGTTECPRCVAGVACPSCGAPRISQARICMACGSRWRAGPRALARRRRAAQVALVVALLIVGLLVLDLTGLLSRALRNPSVGTAQTAVSTSDGSWQFNGSLPATSVINCQDCFRGGIAPGSVFTIRIQMVVGAHCYAALGNFGCFGLNATGLQIDAPFSVAAPAIGQLPVRVCGGGQYNWTISIKAPATPGDYTLAGWVNVQVFVEKFGPPPQYSPPPVNCVLHN